MQKRKSLASALRDVEPFSGYLLALELVEPGAVRVVGTLNPVGRIHVLAGAAGECEFHLHSFRTEHFARILEALRRRFPAHVDDALGVRFDAPAREILCAIAEFDLATGLPASLLS